MHLELRRAALVMTGPFAIKFDDGHEFALTRDSPGLLKRALAAALAAVRETAVGHGRRLDFAAA
eukprot:8360713-Lingulodinium_polyedra.AAC.1